jgi:two-component system OmpR family sensor kinase
MSLRTRLTILYTCALAAVLAISAFIVGRIQLKAMNEHFDDRLVSGAGVVDYALRDRVSDAGLQAASAQLLLRLRLTAVGVAIAAGDGTSRLLFTGSDPDLANALPATACQEAPTSRHTFGDQSYRLLVRCITVHGVAAPLSVVIGAAEHPLIAQRQRLLLVLALTTVIGLALTAVGGHWMSGKTIAPIRDMTTAIQQIGAEQLDQRLPVRAGDGEIAELSQVINALFDRLSALVARERRFLANAAHALRTPVAILRAEVSEATHQAAEDDEAERHLTEIAESVDHLGRTVEYLLSLARRDSGIEVPPTGRMYLDDVASGTVARLSRVFAARDVAVQWGRLEETPVLANTHVADQVLQILLENAAQYCPAGSTVTVSVHPTDAAQGELVVMDDGPGLTAGDRETLFTPFMRGSAARETGSRGTGLGLAVAQWLVEGAGGTIVIGSREPRGTQVVVRFPLSA